MIWDSICSASTLLPTTVAPSQYPLAPQSTAYRLLCFGIKQSIDDVVWAVDLGGIKGRESSLGAGDFGESVLKEGVCLERKVMFGPMKRRWGTYYLAG